MTITDEMLIAYADGELSGEELRLVEAALETRPDLQRFVEQQRTLRDNVESSFARVMNEPVPERLLNVIARAPVSRRWRVQHALRRFGQTVASKRFALWSGLPAGVALACGLLVGIAIVPENAFRMERGEVIAQSTLAKALDQQLASAQSVSDKIRIGVSFKAKDGRYCRTFDEAGSASSLTGVACRGAQGWSVAALASAQSESAGSDYHMAASMPPAIRASVGDMISGEPLDAAAERRARDSGWRAQ